MWQWKNNGNNIWNSNISALCEAADFFSGLHDEEKHPKQKNQLGSEIFSG